MTWRGTAVAKFREIGHRSGKWKKYIDGFHPIGTFIRAEAPPFLSYLRGGAVPANGCEQEGRGQYDRKDVKRDHLGRRKQKTDTQAQPSTRMVFL